MTSPQYITILKILKSCYVTNQGLILLLFLAKITLTNVPNAFNFYLGVYLKTLRET